jgi:hypothetical protein
VWTHSNIVVAFVTTTYQVRCQPYNKGRKNYQGQPLDAHAYGVQLTGDRLVVGGFHHMMNQMRRGACEQEHKRPCGGQHEQAAGLYLGKM